MSDTDGNEQTISDGHKSFIRIIKDPKVREWIHEFVERPHPDRGSLKNKSPRGHYRFTNQQCHDMRQEYSKGDTTVTALAIKHGCSYSTIAHIIGARGSYSHLGKSVSKRQKRG